MLDRFCYQLKIESQRSIHTVVNLNYNYGNIKIVSRSNPKYKREKPGTQITWVYCLNFLMVAVRLYLGLGQTRRNKDLKGHVLQDSWESTGWWERDGDYILSGSIESTSCGWIDVSPDRRLENSEGRLNRSWTRRQDMLLNGWDGSIFKYWKSHNM